MFIALQGNRTNISVIGEALYEAHYVPTPSSRRKPGPSRRAKNWIPAFPGMTMRGSAVISNAKGTHAIALLQKARWRQHRTNREAGLPGGFCYTCLNHNR